MKWRQELRGDTLTHITDGWVIVDREQGDLRIGAIFGTADEADAAWVDLTTRHPYYKSRGALEVVPYEHRFVCDVCKRQAAVGRWGTSRCHHCDGDVMAAEHLIDWLTDAGLLPEFDQYMVGAMAVTFIRSDQPWRAR